MKLLITGAAGFIGFHLNNSLLKLGHEVIGIDNLNDYYDVKLKYDRLVESGIDRSKIKWNEEVQSEKYKLYSFIRMNLENKEELLFVCKKNRFDVIIHLAAQAGVRYSITNPDVYVQSNVVGFLNILEACRYNNVRHLVYASSSSVYGLNEQIPFSVTHSVDHPISLYAATKKSNELMAHSYSHLFHIPTTGLRFFTVYGPWGRPDMACYLFADAIMKGHPINVFNHGKMKRDFTYIDDIVKGIIKVVKRPPVPDRRWTGKAPDPSRSSAPFRIYNIGNNRPVQLLDFISELEKDLGRKAILKLHDMQAGDVSATWANIDDLINEFNYKPGTSIETGLKKFVTWYKKYHTQFKLNGKKTEKENLQVI